VGAAVTANGVEVSRATLRGIRSSVALIVLGVVFMAAAVVIVVFNDHSRCEAGNDFRRHDLPAAFELSHRQIGESLGATPGQIATFDDGFQSELAEVLPTRSCRWFG
jgi:hypothetical protein